MSFVSPVFFLFLPTVLLIYRLCPRKLRWVPLLAASLLFYAWHNVWLLSLVVITVLVSYFCARWMEEAENEKEKKGAAVFCAVVCLGILVVFKYLDFALGNLLSLSKLWGWEIPFDGFDILLPMGISFYVFQTMSYVFDVYRGNERAQHHLGKYALFVLFFPQLVAGPIERPGNLMPQLEEAPNPNGEDVRAGLEFLLRGYGKKVLIADFLAVYVDNAYNRVSSADGGALVLATVFFAFQIYCDFSGYSDIAKGCARLMGIRLMENFRRPYRAVSVRDFWRRWHISLTQWFTDYLYIPLGGSRVSTFKTCRNILLTFLVSGLWHGASWTYVIWGGLHGLYLVAERLILKKRQPGRVVTFLLVCFAWIFFRAASVEEALLVIGRICSPWDWNALLPSLDMSGTELTVGVLLLLLLPKLEEFRLPVSNGQPLNRDKTLTGGALTGFLCLLAIWLCRMLVLTQHGETAFIYFQF